MAEKALKTRILERILRWMSVSVLTRQKPFIIGITGSVGKTTTKDMIAHILRDHKKIWVTQKNYNNEIGVPLTVLCVEKNINSVGGIFHILIKWLNALIGNDYPEILVVEMGVDRPGDMDYLMSIVDPDISVLTAVSQAHSEFFVSIEDIAREKQKIVTQMKKTGTAVINRDDHHVRNVEKKTDAHIVSYGTKDGSDFYASDIEVCFRECNVTGLSFKLNYKGKVIPVRLQNVIAEHLIYAALAALAVADAVQINVVEAIHDIADFVSSPGRMRLLEGRDDVLIIDDTYNASPKAMKAAIASLGSAPAERRIAVVGDMLELGKTSQEAHEKVADQLKENNIDAVFFVGEQMRFAYKKMQKGNRNNAFHFTSSQEAVADVLDYIEQGDVVLVKGSRGMRMEKIVRKIAKDSTQAL